MSKINRILFTLSLFGVAVLSVLALTFFGTRSKGPLGRVLADLGVAVTTVESEIAFQIRGPGRASELAWLNPLRTERSQLAHPDTVLIGAFDNKLPEVFDGLLELESSLQFPMQIVHIFAAWGDEPDQQFPRKMAETIWQIGSIPMITWEPWLSTFDNDAHGHLTPEDERDRGGMAAVANGLYDFYLEEWFAEATEFGHPLFVRFGHEMNDAYRYAWGPHNNTAEEYVAAFRHVVQTARASGAGNILWVWSPHIAYDGFHEYYPGHDVVDWVGATVLNYGNVAYWSEWWTFDDIFTRRYDRLARYGKPIMLAELGTLMAGGDRAEWFSRALSRLPRRLPEVKAIVFFHNRADATITYQSLNWAFSYDDKVVAAVKDALATWTSAARQDQEGDS